MTNRKKIYAQQEKNQWFLVVIRAQHVQLTMLLGEIFAKQYKNLWPAGKKSMPSRTKINAQYNYSLVIIS